MRTSNSALTVKQVKRQRNDGAGAGQDNWFGLKKKTCTINRFKHRCLLEELEKRELLAIQPIDVGVVYVEQQAATEAEGDKFYVAWIGGETGVAQETQMTQIIVNLDKNANGLLDPGEAYFDTENGSLGVSAWSPYKTIERESTAVLKSVSVQDGGQSLILAFEHFGPGDIFVFTIDVDEYQEGDSASSPLVEGAEFGANTKESVLGSRVSTTFADSTHYYGGTWDGMFLDDYDGLFMDENSSRPESLRSAFTAAELPFDNTPDQHGISAAGVYGTLELIVKPISISGTVYADYDVDCNYESTDEAISGVTVTLVSADGTVTLTDVTDDNGFYEFTGLAPGEYDLYCQTNVEGPGGTVYYDFCAKGGDFAQKITPIHINVSDEIQGGQSSDNNNFAKVLPGSINGYVFEDLNNANNKERGEEGIAAITVTLYKLNTTTNQYVKVATTTTDRNGYYEFAISGQYSSINPEIRLNVNGTYLVREGVVEDYTDGNDYLGTFDGEVRGDNSVNEEFSDIYVGFNEHGINYNFGELKLGSIAGNVYEDRNDNGMIDEGEDGIGEVVVDLYQWDGQQYVFLRSSRTEPDGSYRFDNLAICYDYAVKEHQTDDYTDGKDTVGSLGGQIENDYISEIRVGWNEHGIDYNFGELKLGSIAGNVYEDRNDNGIQDEGEKGIDNVTIDLYRWNGETYVFFKSTNTASDGTYFFDDLPICYQYAVKEHQPNDYTDGKDAIGSLGGIIAADDYIVDVEVQWDEHGVEYNFGELKLGYLSGYVYEDDNNNGVKDPGEKGIANVIVELYMLEGDEYVKKDETTTNSEGFYKFTNLDINEKYGIKEIQPEDYEDGKDAVGTLGGTIVQSDYMNNISVRWDDKGYHYDFGEIKPLVPGSLSGYVFFDYNNDGIRNRETDYGIEDVTLTLWIWDTNAHEYVLTGRTTRTNDDGYYIFANLEPERMYRITETQPEGYEDGIDSVGTLFGKVAPDDLYDIVVGSDQHGEFYNFAEIISTPDDPPKEPQSYSWTPTQRSVSVPQRYVGGPNNPFNYILDQPSPSPGTVSFFGGGGLPVSYSWHLSVLNGGYPRSIEALDSVAGFRANRMSNSYMNVSWSGEALNRGEWLIRAADGSVENRYTFGFDNAVPIVGDWDGDGVESLGLFVEGQWFMDRNGDGVWDREDLWAELGSKKDQPVVGDWDGDGKADIGVFGPQWAGDSLAVAVEPGLPADTNSFIPVSRPKNVPPADLGITFGQRVMKHRNSGKVRLDLVDHVFEYGNEGDRAITGDWNGDGVSKIGVWRNGEFYLDVNGNGKWDENDVLISEFSGDKDSIPVVGDFNGDGIDNIGLFHNGRWMLDTNGDYKPDTFFTFGQTGDQPVVGDFNGDGHVQFGVYRSHSSNVEATTGASNSAPAKDSALAQTQTTNLR